MKQEEVLGALIGLTGAISNNGKTADTDRIVAGALTRDDYEKSIRELHEEKNRIAPVSPISAPSTSSCFIPAPSFPLFSYPYSAPSGRF